jgi:hypothetical protein
MGSLKTEIVRLYNCSRSAIQDKTCILNPFIQPHSNTLCSATIQKRREYPKYEIERGATRRLNAMRPERFREKEVYSPKGGHPSHTQKTTTPLIQSF